MATMVKSISLILITISIILLSLPSANAVILWNGTFHGNEQRISTYVFNDPSGNYQTYSCLPQPDSLTIVNANTLGRTGYAGKFYTGVGTAYGCNGNKHDHIIANYDQISYDKQNTFYLGWSQYIQEPPQWLQGSGVSTWMVGTGLSAHVKSVDGVGFYTASYGHTWRMEFEGAGWVHTYSYDNMANKWYDFVLKVKLTRDNTGYYELYMKKPTDTSYQLVSSHYNYITDVYQVNSYWFDIRVGLYTNLNAPYGQTVYILNPKIGTLMSDVTYSGQSVPTPSPTPTPTSSPSPATITTTVNIVGVGSVDVLGYGTVTGSSSFTVPKNSAVTFLATPGNGYTFSKYKDVWSTGTYETTVNPWTDIMSSSDTVTAYFMQSVSTPTPTPTQTVTIPSPLISPPPISTLLDSITLFLKSIFTYLPW